LRGGKWAIRLLLAWLSPKELDGGQNARCRPRLESNKNYLISLMKLRFYEALSAAQQRANVCVFFAQHLSEIAQPGL
jgi:hypothetical protein